MNIMQDIPDMFQILLNASLTLYYNEVTLRNNFLSRATSSHVRAVSCLLDVGNVATFALK